MNGEGAWLKNGNPIGDLRNVPRCGARNRRGTPCQCPAMRNGRCRLHGGLSTGPKTPEGIERIRRAVTKHGQYSKLAEEDRKNCRKVLHDFQQLLAVADALYCARSSTRWERLLNPLTPAEREAVLKKYNKRIEADKARFSGLLKHGPTR